MYISLFVFLNSACYQYGTERKHHAQNNHGASCSILHGLGSVCVNLLSLILQSIEMILSPVLFSYTRHSMNEAKWNAQRDRERRQARGMPSPEDESGQNGRRQ
ncbi:hypothetical protein GGR55DRAFT_664638 [Xylaria sp. FL0064]|nr:hypothetical protein GGR55DRAFT_664638 [Xylaria sp. FL0064]